MIDTAVITIVPPIVASIFAYLVANKRARIQYSKTVASIQYKAIEIVAEAEKKMREEIRADLALVRAENEKQKEELVKLRHKLDNSDELIATLRAEIISLKSLIETYKEQLSSLRRENEHI